MRHINLESNFIIVLKLQLYYCFVCQSWKEKDRMRDASLLWSVNALRADLSRSSQICLQKCAKLIIAI